MVRIARGAIRGLSDDWIALGMRRPILVCTPARRFVDRISPPLPTIAIAAEHGPVQIRDRARTLLGNADGLIAIGGGSAIGLGKALAAATALPLIAVPTTFAGSALTDTFGMTEGNKKTVHRAETARARLAVYDPALYDDFVGVPAAASAFNAIAHACDALFAGAPAEDAIPAITTLAAMLPRRSPGPCERRVEAARQAATCLAAFGAGLHHRLCHAISGRHGTPHGLTHALVLPHMIALGATKHAKTVSAISRALGCEDAAIALHAIARDCGIDGGLRALGVPEMALPLLAETLIDGGIARSAALHTLHNIWAGTPPRASLHY